MSSIRIPEETKTQIDDALDNLNSLEKLRESKLLSLCMVTRHVKRNPSVLPSQALKAVLTETLDLLEKENSDHGDILRGRFWEGLNATQMIAVGRPKKWSEKTFFNYQKEARSEFHSLLWQKEEKYRDDEKKRRLLSTALISVGLILLATIFAVFLLGFPQPPAQASISATLPSMPTLVNLTPTSTPAPTFTPASITETSLCGETEQKAVDLGIPRFVRSQGVSNFTMENTPGLLNNTVRSLAIDKTGLWIGYFGKSGLGHYDKKNFLNCALSKIMGWQDINALAISKTGKIWVGTEKNGVASFDGKEWRSYTTNDGLPHNEIYGLTIDEQDNVWAGTWEGVAKFDGTSWSVPYHVRNETIFNNHVGPIAFDSEKNIWVGHLGDGISLYQQKNSKWVNYTTKNGLAGNEVRSIIIRPKSDQQPESVWVATVNGGISRFQQGQWTTYRVEDGLPINNVNDLALDRYNRIWAATDKGVSYFDDKSWKPYHSLATSTIAIGGSCLGTSCPFDDDHVWTGTPTLGLTHSRLPLPDAAIKVTKICFVAFVTSERETTCPSFDISFDRSLSESIVTATFPEPLKPDETLRFEITVSPEETYQLQENRGDFISNTDDNDSNLFGAWPLIGVKGTIETGQPYTFTDYDNPFVAPKLPDGIQEKQFISTWRIWMYTRYVGPYIRLVFTVKND
jgi:hypothetical protein